MSMQDTIADMLTRMRNAQAVKKQEVTMASSNLKVAICKILKEEGYITDYQVKEEGAKRWLVIQLKYYVGKPVISRIKRVSKASRRVYVSAKDLPLVLHGLGVAIVSTSRGIMTSKAAKRVGIGGEVLCEVI